MKRGDAVEHRPATALHERRASASSLESSDRSAQPSILSTGDREQPLQLLEPVEDHDYARWIVDVLEHQKATVAGDVVFAHDRVAVIAGVEHFDTVTHDWKLAKIWLQGQLKASGST
jgi:hypothetical protein